MNTPIEMENKKLKRELCIAKFAFIIMVVIFILVFSFANHPYKKGYEDAVEDFYNGKLKCDRIEETTIKYIWKNEEGGEGLK